MSRQLIVKSSALAAGVEAVTGSVLIIHPSLFVRLLFGAGLSNAGQALGRLAGFALLALALACWPGPQSATRSAFRSLLAFSLLSTVYLASLGMAGELVGVLLWPAAILHAALTMVLALGCVKILRVAEATAK
jgi:hypothetical protein